MQKPPVLTGRWRRCIDFKVSSIELTNRRKMHVTRMLLWEEDHQAGHIHMKYSRFCYRLQRYLKSKHPSLVQQHQPGDKIFLDFAGDKLGVIDRATGREQPVETLPLTLGYSNYTVATCITPQKNEHLFLERDFRACRFIV